MNRYEELIEALCELVHNIWAKWMKVNLLAECEIWEDGKSFELIHEIPEECYEKWQEQIIMKCKDLPEREQEIIRENVFEILEKVTEKYYLQEK